MSSYKDFSRCIICRTKLNMNNYHNGNGSYEVTMLINSLYIAVMFPLEKRKNFILDYDVLEAYLLEQGIVDTHGNVFSAEDYLRNLRNGLAHFHIKTTGNDDTIDTVEIWAEYKPFEPQCGKFDKCKSHKCLGNKSYKTHEKTICTFTFKIDQLQKFADMLIKIILNNPFSRCNTCETKPLIDNLLRSM